MENPLYQFAPDGTCLIETLGYRRDEGCRYFDLHLARLQRSAQALEFKVDIKTIRIRLQAIKSAAAPLPAYGSARRTLRAPHHVLTRKDTVMVSGDCATAPYL